MEWPRSISEQLDRVVGDTLPVDDGAAEGRLNALSGALADLDRELREQIQAATAAQVTSLIAALQADGPVGPAELELIRLWLVGDAEYYVKMENDLPAWLAELNRLLGVLRQLRTEPATPVVLARMEATVRDALRVTSDIAFFREQEERVRSFQAATGRLTRDDKQTLARLLTQKLRSPRM